MLDLIFCILALTVVTAIFPAVGGCLWALSALWVAWWFLSYWFKRQIQYKNEQQLKDVMAGKSKFTASGDIIPVKPKEPWLSAEDKKFTAKVIFSIWFFMMVLGFFSYIFK